MQVGPGSVMPLQYVKDSGYTSLDFRCYVELLHICYFEWVEKEKNTEISENENSDEFYSDNFNDNSFCIACSPKAWRDENKHTFSFVIKLLRLQMDIASTLLYFRMESNLMDHDVEGLEGFGYEQCRSGWPDEDEDRYDSELINDLSEIKMKCTIKIKALEIWDIDEYINENEWMKYGIID